MKSYFARFSNTLLALTGSVLLTTQLTQAATFTWNAGTLDSTDGSWATATNWTGDTAPSNGDDLIFDELLNQTNANDLLTSIASLTLNNAGWNITLNTLSIGTGGIVANGTSALSGTLTLGGAQTWSNSTGVLTVTGTVANGGNLLTIGGAGDTTISSDISGAGGLTKLGAGTLTLSGANGYTGATTISVGTLKLGSTSALGTIAAGTSVTATGAALDLNGITLSTAEALSIIGTGVGSTGALTNSGAAASYSGIVTIGTGGASIGGSGDITLSAGLATNANALTKVGTGTLTLSAGSSRTGTVTISDGILKVATGSSLGTNAAAVTVNGTGTFDLGGVNYTTTSALSLSGTGAGGIGALINSSGPSFPSTYAGIVTIAAAGTSIGGSGDITLTLALAANANSFVKTGAGTLVLTAASTRTGAVSIDQGTLRLLNATAAGTAATVLTLNGGNLELRSAAATFLNGLTMSSSGATITVNPATAGNGVTHLISGATTLGGGQTLVMSAGSLSTINTAYGLTLSGNKTLTGDSTYTINANGSATGTLSLITGTIDTQGATRTLTFNTGSGTGTRTATISGAFTGTAGTLVLAGSAPVTVGALTGTANAVQVNSSTGGIYTFNGLSTYTGGTTLTSGTLVLDVASTLPTNGPVGLGTLTLAGGTVRTAGTSRIVNNVLSITGDTTFGAATFAGVLTLGGAASTTGTRALTFNNTTSVLSGLLTLGGDLTTSGTGGATLSGGIALGGSDRTLTGNTTGTTTISGALSSSAGSNKLILTGTGVTVGAVLAGTNNPAIEVNGAGTYTFNGASTYTGGTTLTSGTMVMGASSTGAITNGPVGTGTLTLAGGTVRATASPFAVNNVLSITGDTTIGAAGQAGVLTLGGVKTTTGARTVTFNNTTTVLNGGALTLGGALLMNGTSGATFGSTITTAGNTITFSSSGTFDLQATAATVTGAGGVTITSGRVNMGGGGTAPTHTYSGDTNINGGIMMFHNNWSANSNININGGILETYLGGTLSQTLGAAANQIRITGGVSGFSSNGATGTTVTLGGGTITWGSANFAPTKLVLQSSASQTGSTINFTNAINLSGSDRTVVANIGVSNAASTLSGVISNSTGTAGLIKEGAGSLTLSNASNTFNGHITINAGSLTFGAVGSWGTGAKNVTFTGNGTVASTTAGYTGGILDTGAFTAIVSGSSLTFASTTGSGTVRLLNSVGGAMLNLGNASAFTGNLRVDIGGTTNANPIVRFSSISDTVGSKLQFGGTNGDSNQQAEIRYVGTAPLVFDNRVVETLLQPSSNAPRYSRISNESVLAANTWTINTNYSMLSTQSRELELAGTNTGDNTFAGLISNGSGTISLYKTGAGKWIVSNNNTFTGFVAVGGGTLVLSGTNQYTGSTTITGGTLVASSIKAFGTASSLGAPASGSIPVSAFGSAVTLSYVGSGDTSNRTFSFIPYNISDSPAFTLENNGSGALVFNGSSFNVNSNTASRLFTFTVGGTYTGGTNEIQGTIVNYFTGASDTVNVAKSGAGTWKFSGSNTYTGTTSISNGTLAITTLRDVGVGASSLGAPITSANGTISLGSGATAATLRYDGTGNTSNRVINLAGSTGGASLINEGTGTWRLTGNLAAVAGVKALTLGGSTTGIGEFAGVIGNGSGTISVTKNGTGTWVLSGANTYGGGTTISNGILTVKNASGLGTGAGRNVSVAAGAGLEYAATANSNLSISGTLGITGGAGTVIGGSIGSSLTGAQIAVTGIATATGAIGVNIYGVSGLSAVTGTYTLVSGGAGSSLNGGTYTLGNIFNATDFTVGALSSTATTLDVGITAVTPLTGAFWTGGLAGATNVWAASDGTANSNWFTTASGGATPLVPGAGTDVTISANTITTAPTATVLGANMSIRSLTISDTVNGLGLNADGSTLTIANAAGITMSATVPASTIAANVALGASQTWTNDSINSLTVSGSISGASDLIKAGTGTIILSGNNTFSGTTTVSAGTLTVANGFALQNSALVTTSGTSLYTGGSILALGGLSGATGNLGSANVLSGYTGVVNDLRLNVSGTLTYGGVISNGVAGMTLTKNGAGTQILSGTNTYTGATTINAGTLRAGAAAGGQAFGSGSAVTTANVAGATLDLNGFSQTIGSLAGGGTTGGNVTLGTNATLTAGGNGTSTTFAGIISGTGTSGFIKAGAGTLILTGTNTYTGDTTITGTLQIGNNAGTASLGGGTYAGNILNNGTLDFQTGATQTLSGVISGTGAILFRNVGTWTLTGSNTYTGKTTINAITNTTSPTLIVSSFNSVNGGTPLLASSSLGAPTSVANGTIEMGSANSSPNPTIRYTGTGETTDRVIHMIFNSGAVRTLQANGTGLLKFTSAFTATGQATGGVTLTGTGLGELAGALPTLGSGAFTKSGTGTWRLSGTGNAYVNPTTVSDGTLILTKARTVAMNAALTVAANKRFIYAPTAAGALNLGTGVLTLSSGTTTRIGTALGGTASQSAITSTGAASLAGTGFVDIYGITGVAPTAGVNNLITAASGLTGGTYTLGTVYNNTNFTVSGFTRSATAISVTVTAQTAITDAFWKGGLAGNTNVWAASDGSANSNWTTTAGGAVQALTPGSGATVNISATAPTTAPTATVLGADMSIAGLVISDTTNGLGLNADGNYLTIGTGGITMDASVPTSTIAAQVILGGNQSWTNNSANTLNVSGEISGSSSLTKAGTGTLTLTGFNSYTGSTTINQGILIVSGNGIINRSAVTINGGNFRYNATNVYSNTLTYTSGTLSGTNWGGSLGGLTIGTGQTISPGNSPGIVTTTSQTWAAGGTYEWEINNVSGTAGVDWDLINGSAALTIAATSGSEFTIDVMSLTLANAAGALTGFNDATNYNWLITDFLSISGFNTSDFIVDTTQFAVHNTFTGSFGVALGDSPGIGGDNSQIWLTYTAIPEPQTALLGALGLLLLLRRRR